MMLDVAERIAACRVACRIGEVGAMMAQVVRIAHFLEYEGISQGN